MLISNELLSEVLDIPLENLKYRYDLDSYEVFYPKLFNWSIGDYGRWSNLKFNKYELAHKCKEWALTQKIDNSPKENPFKYKVLSNLDIIIYKHPVEDGYISKISPLFYSNDTNLNIFGINLNLYDETIIDNAFDSLTFYADVESEAVIKACQWILEIKNNKTH